MLPRVALSKTIINDVKVGSAEECEARSIDPQLGQRHCPCIFYGIFISEDDEGERNVIVHF